MPKLCGGALVGVLLLACGPTAIGRCVVTIVVDSVQCERFVAFQSHIGKEIRESMPTLADSNSAPAVVLVSDMSGALTSRNHACPRVVFGREVLASGVTMDDAASSGGCLLYLTVSTPTTCGIAAPQRTCPHNYQCAAIAQT